MSPITGAYSTGALEEREAGLAAVLAGTASGTEPRGVVAVAKAGRQQVADTQAGRHRRGAAAGGHGCGWGCQTRINGGMDGMGAAETREGQGAVAVDRVAKKKRGRQ